MSRIEAVITVIPAGFQAIEFRVHRSSGAGRLDVVGLPHALCKSTEARVVSALGEMPRCRCVARVVRPGGAYASEEVDQAIIAALHTYAPEVCS